eukprot:c20552_g2_i2.p1 GENE.c20552_g2_i2~~c20552_g2_i2.p1  ORF type:complete len:449 (+),score=153.36 c20552_g2_i2:1241-2587(+)
MDEEYDCVILGTGLKECILSGILSVTKHKVLHLDKNDYYGGDSASLNLQQLFEHFRGAGSVPDEKKFADNKRLSDYNIDLIPKLIMANGSLVKMLVFTQVHRYIELGQIEGSYVYHNGSLEKVPASDTEALKSNLLGLLEKRRCHKFFSFTAEWDENNPQTHKGYNLNTMTMDKLYDEYSLSGTTKDFIGHSIALHRDDIYLSQPAADTVRKMQLYFQSMLRYGKSPYIYPMYGLGELPQAFARLSAVYGGTYMLRKPFHGVEYDAEGKVSGVKSENGELAKCKFVVADPSYFPEKVKKTGQIVRCICFLSSPPIAGIGSAQIIIPAKQVNRKSDIYVSYLSNAHNVVPNGKFLAIAAALVETSNPHAELDPGIKVLGKGIVEQFYSVTDLLEPTEDGTKDRIFISKSFDQTSHFETTCDDILDMYKRITGKELDLSVTNLDALRDGS